ncbi:Gfo/Idh/MocA family oxidoreductase [Streptomyces sp. NBC_00076]|uniref:Gfo/Idh/MocA family oxidoreductase n=1 Tax=Streptomyces sp. NBC_00076 TaxID=2975642 RepID=UPI00324F22AC
MPVRVGVIGAGMIGQDHIRRLTDVVTGATVTAVTDIDQARATEVAARVGATALPTGADLIGSPDVDAVLVTSWGPTHAGHVLAAVTAGKPVFCEKPLATTAEDCLRIVEAERARGRRLVQVGFMRRFDAGYRQMKEVLDSGSLGAPIALTAVQSLSDAGTKAEIATFDLNKELVKAVQDGTIEFAVDQQPYLQGYLSVDALWLYRNNGNVSGGGTAPVLTGPAFITKENADSVAEFAAKGTR